MASGRKAAASSPLPAKTNQRRNTQAGRDQMAGSSFAIPEEKKYRIDDPAHARNALARVAQHGTDEEKRRVRAAVRKRYPSIAIADDVQVRSSKGK